MTSAPLRHGRLFSCVLALATGLAGADDVPLRGCATHLEVMKLLQQESGNQAASVASTAATQAATLRGRTYLTPHFAIHYTLAPTVNRPRWVPDAPGDPALKTLVDSLLTSLASLPAAVRDSTLHARLDSMNASHPRYVVRAGEHFERARQYYDSLGMRMPDSSASRYFVAPPVHGRVAIDIANIGTVEPSYNGAYYGLAFPPSGADGASILLENDFLYGATYNASLGQATGTPIRAIYKGQTYRDYSAQWDMGLKVTAVHEFYHIVQYEYTPSLAGYHAWYELSATGMEERLAPEVNDYFQYLPFNLQRNHDIPLTSAGTLANYGNAVFHVFLTEAKGADFDRAVWEHLGDSSQSPRNHMGNALVAMAGSQSAWDDLFANYAAAISISGTPGAAGSPLAFSPDMAEWPVPYFDTVPASQSAQLPLAALTFRLARPPLAGTGLATLIGFANSRRVDSSAAGYQATTQTSGVVPVSKGLGVTRSTSVFAHSGLSGTRHVLLSKPAASFQIARNPVPRGSGPLFVLASSPGSTDTLRVVAESGRRVATVPVDTSGLFWNWDLRDANAKIVPAGVYYVRPTGEPPQPLLILP